MWFVGNRLGRMLCVVCGGLVLVGPSPSQARQGVETAAHSLQGQRSRRPDRPSTRKQARKALAAAGRLARIPRGTDSAERNRLLERACEAFGEVARRFAGQSEIVAEASFRQGQVLGRLARSEEALAAFESAASSKAFAARALLESGHLLRREKRYPDAAVCYGRAVENKGGRYSDQARLWLGKTLVHLGRVPDARRTWHALGSDTTADSGTRIRAFDELAMSYVREKRIAEAKRVLQDAESTLAAEISGEDKNAERLRGRFNRMRAHKSIAKAEAKATREKR